MSQSSGSVRCPWRARSGAGCLVGPGSQGLVRAIPPNNFLLRQLTHIRRSSRCCPILVWQAAELLFWRQLRPDCRRQWWLLSAISGHLLRDPLTFCRPQRSLYVCPRVSPLPLSWRSEVASESLRVSACVLARCMTEESSRVNLAGYSSSFLTKHSMSSFTKPQRQMHQLTCQRTLRV